MPECYLPTGPFSLPSIPIPPEERLFSAAAAANAIAGSWPCDFLGGTALGRAIHETDCRMPLALSLGRVYNVGTMTSYKVN